VELFGRPPEIGQDRDARGTAGDETVDGDELDGQPELFHRLGQVVEFEHEALLFEFEQLET